MRNSLKLASAVAAVVGMSFSMPLFAAENPCAGLKGEELSKCRKEARAADDKATKPKGAAAAGSSEVAGKMQKSPTGMDKEKTSLPTAPPKGSPETTTAADKGTTKSDRATSKSGAMSPAAPKGSSEVAPGADKKK